VANGPGVIVDFPVVSARERLVAKEMDGLVLDAAGLLRLVLEVLEAVGLVPAIGEDVEGDLATNGEGKAEVAEALLQLVDKGLADLGLVIVVLEVETLLGGGVAADGADVDHAVAELDKGAALDGDVEVGNVVEAKVDELLVLVLADPLDEAVGGQGLAELVGDEAVLGEAKVEERGDGDAGGLAELLLLLDEVGAADEADGALLAESLEEIEHLVGGGLTRQTEGAINVKETDGVLHGTILERRELGRGAGHCGDGEERDGGGGGRRGRLSVLKALEEKAMAQEGARTTKHTMPEVA
jgi:hypothetical protein